jgi:hypothetical protein
MLTASRPGLILLLMSAWSTCPRHLVIDVMQPRALAT